MTSTKVDKFNPKDCVDLEFLVQEVKNLNREGILTNLNEENAHKTRLGEYLMVM